MLALSRMAHACFGVDAVPVASPHSLPCDVPSLDQIVREALGRTFGDANGACDIAHPCLLVVSDAEKDLRVVRQEVPAI
jgi:hypothetical protein